MEELIINLACSSIEDYTKDTEDKVIKSHRLLSEKAIRDWFESKRKSITPIWDEISLIGGFFINVHSEIIEQTISAPTIIMNKNICKELKHAKSILAAAQISQLIPYYGGAVTDEEWQNPEISKYLITRSGNSIQYGQTTLAYGFLAFKTYEDGDRFLSREENLRLVKDYYMLD